MARHRAAAGVGSGPVRSIVTERLVLRPWTAEDLSAWQALHSDPAVLEFVGDGTAPDSEIVAERLDRVIASWDDRGIGLFACERLDVAGDGPLGWVGFAEPTFLPELLPVLEIGWRLGRAAWGNGYATEGARAALNWAFENDLLDRVVSCVQVGNERSTAVAERLGMRPLFRTVVPAHRRWADVYELTADEWEP